MAESPESAPLERYARLVFSRSGGGEVVKNILRPTTLIGSMRGCNLRIESADVAPAHCVLTVDDGVLRVRDLRSTTGTRVNGQQIDVATLIDGDILDVASFEFRVETNLVPVARGSRRASTPSGQLGSSSANSGAFRTNGLSDKDVKSLLMRGLITPDQQLWLQEGKFRVFRLEHYRVLELLGAGGMGWVYAAEEADSGQRVALKVISRQQPVGILARFRLEARAGMRLDHPHIVRTYRLGETDAVFFVTMELVRGINLQELIDKRGPLAWRHACDLTLQAARALEHAHARELIHRDIKPANLLIDREGSLKVLDFGLSLINDDEEEFSLAMIAGQNCIGTPEYIAPEQSIDSFTVDGRADIYSLGCTLYYALTGTVPFGGETVREKLDAHRSGRFTPLADRRPELPAELVEIVHRMIAKEPAERFRSAAEVAKAIEPLARRHPVQFDFDSLLEMRKSSAKLRVGEWLRKIEAQSMSSSIANLKRDPVLADLVRLWPKLPPEVRQSMLSLVNQDEK